MGESAGSVVDAAFAVKVGEVVDVVGVVEVDVRAPGMSDHQNVGMKPSPAPLHPRGPSNMVPKVCVWTLQIF